MKKYQYLASWDDQTLTRVGEPVVVLGDSNVSQVEVILPSDFLLDPTGAVARMYFLLPGEKESGFETLETATKDDNGDSHVTWIIKHVHSRKGGRLAFSLTLIGDDAQWDSRTAIIPVYESRYQPESEEAEEPYTGRLDALEGSMAAIRGEFAEVQDDFEELKETATLGTPIPESLVANMTEGHVYIYTGTEPGYTAGHVYYYVGGTLTDGGVYGGTAVDATLTQSGQAADAKKTGDEISAIKEDLNYSLRDSKDLTSEYIAGGYIKTSLSIGATVDVNTVTTSSNYAYIIVPCRKGDSFKITGYAGSTPRLWAFTDSSYKLLSVANAEINVSDLTLTASQDGYFISDVYKFNAYALTHYYIDDVIARLEAGEVNIDKLLVSEIENIMQIPSHYYNSATGVLNYASGFTCTNMIKVNPNDILQITTSAGNNVGVAGYGIDKQYNSRILEVGSAAIYDVERGVLTTEITVPSDVYYITVSNVAPNDTDIVVKSNNPKCNEENPIIKMLVVPMSTTGFWVYVLSNINGRYLRHRFTKQYYSDTLSYGDSQTKDVVGADIWYSNMIDDGSTNVMAGNFNFIHSISNMAGHNGYVGAGHGCTVANWTIFKADGTAFDPSITTRMTECSEFDFIIKADNYLIDKPNSPSESHAVPTLDNDGNPIITSVNTINAKMRVGNEIEYRNRLIFKMDGIQFSECHGSMCEGYFSAFDNLIIENKEESWNYIDSSNDYARTKMNGTQWDLFTAGSKKALSVIMFGDKYLVENKLIQLDGIRNKITNTRTALYRDNGARMKVYLMPTVCTISAENIADGASVETFNTGDILDVVSYRKITLS